MTKHFDLAGLIGSRICHDIISPLGAVGNGVELMVLSGQDASPEFDLVKESIESASLRIKFFRVAFGQSAAGQTVSRSDVQMLTRAAAAGGRMTILWPTETGLPRPEVKRVLLGILCLEHLLPSGGTITISPDGTGGWLLHALGTKIKDAPHLIASLQSGERDAELAPAEVQFALLRMEAEAQGRVISLDVGSGTMMLTA